MKDPYLLHMFNPTKNVSPFDVNMAYEATFQGVIPYTEVTLEDIHALTQDTIFSRGPKGVKRTCIFIGGREFGLAMDMLNRARMAMVPPFEVSVFADPSGAITTAAATIACIEHLMKNKKKTDLKDKSLYIFGGTGPVGVCAGILASKCGARVYLASHRGAEVGAKVAEEYNARFNVNMDGANSGSDAAIEEILQSAQIVIGAAKAGIQILSRGQLEQAAELEIAADINAVPPLGFEGIEVHDNGKKLDFTPKKAL
ncbi:MAG: NAD(P)-dependent methylenetetrahydromethanopterin dehydrogenase, partial [Gammaproteobacteria bacterium]|nr:NAD(P)-dependent methylenetetrahydromethanopterin dehydrogenase [Gammaproteobacteria bacterium]